MTFDPYSSIDLIMSACGSVPALYFISNRPAPKTRIVAAIFRATVSGDPT